MDAPMISIENLSKTYGPTHALQGISFQVPKGQVVGFLGPNGAGKSTTMKILTGFVEPSGGAVKVGGISVDADPVGARRLIGYLPENNPLYEDMMVEEYLDYVADMRQVPTSQRKKRIGDAVARCGIGGVRGKDIGELSKGYRQRVGLAQAILHDPALLILDEPTTGLDPNQVVEIRNLIKELGQEKTVIMSTHVLPEVQHTCSRAIIIADGKLVADGSPQELATEGGVVKVVLVGKDGTTGGDLEQRARQVLAAIGGVHEIVRDDTGEPGALSLIVRHGAPTKSPGSALTGGDDVRRAVFEACVRADLVLLGLERRQVSLEETFRRLTKV